MISTLNKPSIILANKLPGQIKYFKDKLFYDFVFKMLAFWKYRNLSFNKKFYMSLVTINKRETIYRPTFFKLVVIEYISIAIKKTYW